MQLVYFIDIFENNYNIARDRFETFSTHEKTETQGNFSIYQLGLVTSENHEIFTRKNKSPNFRKP